MKPATRALFLAVAALGTWVLVARAPAPAAGGPSLVRRVLGPFSALVARAEWIRFDALWRAGEHERAWIHADRALELHPDASDWIYLAHHAIYDRAAPRRALPPDERRRWVEIGLALLDRGAQASGATGPIEFKRGIVYLSLASEAEGHRALPIARAEAWTRAAEAFERAAAAGEPLAAAAAQIAREAAAHAPP